MNAHLKVKLVLDEVVDVPTLALPVKAILARGFDGKPIHVRLLIRINVLDQCLQLLHS